jgi:molybdopterin synthase sulfur carrier subunit
MRVKYFAWVRERLGLAEEEIDPPAEVVTVADFIGWLAGRDELYAFALERPEVIRAALDQRHAAPTARIAGAREIALFPPMTGG